jgi:hypothetical protein
MLVTEETFSKTLFQTAYINSWLVLKVNTHFTHAHTHEHGTDAQSTE